MELQRKQNRRPRFVLPNWEKEAKETSFQPWNPVELAGLARKDSTRNGTILGKISSEIAESICGCKDSLYIVQWDNRIWLCSNHGWVRFVQDNVWNVFLHGTSHNRC